MFTYLDSVAVLDIVAMALDSRCRLVADIYIPRFGGCSGHCGNGVRQSLSFGGGYLHT